MLDMDEPSNSSFVVDVGETSQSRREAARMQTRSQARAATNGNSEENRIRALISESIGNLREEITNIISNELRDMMRNLNVNAGGSAPLGSVDRIPPTSPRDREEGHNGPIHTEKVLNIIRNWRIKFTGYSNCMPVEEFIYRVNTLVTDNLASDFGLLCRNACCLFEGKALEWYWRYHRQHPDMRWEDLSTALKAHYKDDYSDYDILDDIRKRKQRTAESIDEFLETVSTMADRLKNPMSEVDLCETVIRNLRPEVRHELLYLDINSLSKLRKEVRKHERFMKEVHSKESRTQRIRIAEVTNLDEESDSDKAVSEEVCAIGLLRCWNCDKIGHAYFDCMGPRRIFCYGCGQLDTYKPACPRCTKKNQGNVKTDVPRK